MNLADRLRSVVRTADAQGASAPAIHTRFPPATPDGRRVGPQRDPAEVLDGEWRSANGQRYLVVDRVFRPGYRMGRVAVADCLQAMDEGAGWPSVLLPPAGVRAAGRLLFLDVETTGLAGGAGTYAFLIGCGWLDGAVFRVRQFLLTSVTAERALLEELAGIMRASAILVTYNGKAFDAPLIETRFLFHRLEAPCCEIAHLDLLHHARRFWRSTSVAPDEAPLTCRLSFIERQVLGHVRDDDIGGFEVPSRYFQFVRTGDSRGLEAVLEHNRLDLISLAMLTARLAQLVEEGAPAARGAREALGLGVLYARRGMTDEARACFARAIALESDELTRAEALRAHAVFCRRERRYEEAAESWRRILALPAPPQRLLQEAADALAVHHEHRARDLPAARDFAWQSLQYSVSASRSRAGRHRLARLDRKLGGPSIGSAPLF